MEEWAEEKKKETYEMYERGMISIDEYRLRLRLINEAWIEINGEVK